MTPLEAATAYLARGWNPVPIKYMNKKPIGNAWQNRTITANNIAAHFNGAQLNIGVQLGPKSHGLTDVDLDCDEAMRLARHFLPPTPAMFGRASKPISHLLYQIDDPPDFSVLKLTDKAGKGGKGIIELRIGGGKKGAQTVFPHSVHESGEAIEWAHEGAPTHSDYATLAKAVRKIAAGTILRRAWPGGSGHAAALALGGFLARVGWSPDEIEKFVKVIVPDKSWAKDSSRTAKDSAEEFAAGKPAQGFPSLREQFGEEPAKAVAKVIGYGEGESAEGFAVKDGIPYNSQGNIKHALEKLGVKVRHNLFEDRPIIEGLANFELLDDRAMNRLWLTIDEKFKFRPPKDFFWTVVFDEAYRNSFHPVREYLDGLRWDGVKRIDSWLFDYGGAADSKYIRAVGALILLAGVRRIRSPGCKFDEMPVLHSEQGFNKSTALSILAVKPEWFSDDLPLNADSKKTIERLRGRWIVEAAELKGMRSGEIEHLKAFLSRTVDRARMSYDRASSELKRQCIIVGTTNDEKFLRDQTGNRRYWPARDIKFDLEKLTRDRDQLWAEASAREAEGISIRLPKELWSAAGVEQEEHTIKEPWIEVIESLLEGIDGKLLSTDAWLLVGVTADKRTQTHNQRLGIAMRGAGWERTKRSFGKLGTRNAYVRRGYEEGKDLKRVLVFGDWRTGITEVRLAVDDDDDDGNTNFNTVE